MISREVFLVVLGAALILLGVGTLISERAVVVLAAVVSIIAGIFAFLRLQ